MKNDTLFGLSLDKKKQEISNQYFGKSQIGCILIALGIIAGAASAGVFLRQKFLTEMFTNFNNLQNFTSTIVNLPNTTDFSIVLDNINQKIRTISIAASIATAVFGVAAIAIYIYSIYQPRTEYPYYREPDSDEDIQKNLSKINPIFNSLVCLTGVSIGVITTMYLLLDNNFLSNIYSNFLEYSNNAASSQILIEHWSKNHNIVMGMAIAIGSAAIITGIALIIAQTVQNSQNKEQNI